MKTSTSGMLTRVWRWGLVALPVTVVVALALTFAANGHGADQAAAQEPSVNFSIEVNGCSTRPGDLTKCNVGLGSQFTVGLTLEGFAGFPGDAYAGVQARLTYSAGLTLNNRPVITEIEGVWPDCVFPAENKDVAPNTYLVGCAVGVPLVENTTTYTGRVVEVDFTCTDVVSQQTVTMVHGAPLSTQLIDVNALAVWEATPSEALTINCIEAPPTATPTPVPPTPTPATVPFPWDVDNDGFVTIGDVFEVAGHFGEAVP